MARPKAPSYPRHKKGTLRWGRVLLLIGALAGGSIFFWYEAPAPDPSQKKFEELAAAIEKQTTPDVQNLGRAALPGQLPEDPKKPAVDPVRQAVATRTANATATNATQEQQAPPLPLPAKPTGTSPFMGKSLAQVTAEMATHRFIGRSPQDWGENLPGITTHLTHVWQAVKMPEQNVHGATPQQTAGAVQNARATVALTLDACGGRAGQSYDSELIAFLRAERIPATLFVSSLWIKNNRATLQELAADPLFEIASHGARHKPASIDGRSAYGNKGTASLAELIAEVEGNVRDIESATGKRPRWYRSGTAFYDDIAVSVIRLLHLGIAGYSIAADEGATLPAAKVEAKALAAKDGDIILAHMNHPKSGTREGLIKALTTLKANGVAFVPLSPPAKM